VAIERDIKKNNARALWPHIEALAYFLPEEYDPWFASDDADGILDTIKMIGGAVMVALRQLQDEGLLAKNSAIPNIGLVIGALKRFERYWPGGVGDDPQWSWVNATLYEVKQAGFELKDAPYGIEPEVRELQGTTGDWDQEDVNWKEFNREEQVGEDDTFLLFANQPHR
jgi:hypothetical protein